MLLACSHGSPRGWPISRRCSLFALAARSRRHGGGGLLAGRAACESCAVPLSAADRQQVAPVCCLLRCLDEQLVVLKTRTSKLIGLNKTRDLIAGKERQQSLRLTYVYQSRRYRERRLGIVSSSGFASRAIEACFEYANPC